MEYSQWNKPNWGHRKEELPQDGYVVIEDCSHPESPAYKFAFNRGKEAPAHSYYYMFPTKTGLNNHLKHYLDDNGNVPDYLIIKKINFTYQDMEINND